MKGREGEEWRGVKGRSEGEGMMHTHNIIKTKVSSISVSTTNKSEHKSTVVCSGYVCVIHVHCTELLLPRLK